MIGQIRLRNRRCCSKAVLAQRLKRIPDVADGLSRQFTLRGRFPFENAVENYIVEAGVSRTIFLARRGSGLFSFDNSYTQDTPSVKAFLVGSIIAEPDPTGGGTVSGPSNANLAQGATALTINSGTVTGSTWYYLWYTNELETNAFGGTRKIGGELVYVKSVSGGVATIRDGLARPFPYSANLRLTPLPTNAKVCEDIRFRNFNIKAATYQPGDPSGLLGLIYTAYCAGLDLQRCKLTGSYSAQLYFNFSREITITNCQGYECDGPNDLLSFAFCAQRCVNITVRDVYLRNTQYGISFTAGCANFLVERLATIGNTQASFDLHGGSTEGGTARFIFCPESQIQIGNPGWTLSCKSITVEDSTCAYITAKGWARDCVFQGITAKWIGFVGSKPSGSALSGGPNNVAVSNSVFNIDANNASYGRGAIQVLSTRAPKVTGAYYGQFQNITFTSCTFETNQQSYGVVHVRPLEPDKPNDNPPFYGEFGPMTLSSQLTFLECTLTQASGTPYQTAMQLNVLPTALDEFLEVNLSDCVVNVHQSQSVGIGTGPSSAEVVIHNNTNGGQTPNVRSPNPTNPTPGSTRNLQSSDFPGSTWDSN